MRASTNFPIHELMAQRWSPYSFTDKPVSDDDLRSLFEAARWAPSSYNEQPWHYIVAKKEHPDDFARLLSCLVEGNQGWAQAVPVLALGVVRLYMTRNNDPNRAAMHDLGLASGALALEATARGLQVHQMIGILPDKARELYAIPDGYEALTALAIGYPGAPERLSERYRDRDRTRRPRNPLQDFVFDGQWGKPSAIVS